jgi:hypothetical protein
MPLVFRGPCMAGLNTTAKYVERRAPRRGVTVGWPFLWFRFFWPPKRNEPVAFRRNEDKQLELLGYGNLHEISKYRSIEHADEIISHVA